MQGSIRLNFGIPSKKFGKDQESIQSRTKSDPGYQWKSDRKIAFDNNKSGQCLCYSLGECIEYGYSFRSSSEYITLCFNSLYVWYFIMHFRSCYSPILTVPV